MGLGCWQLSRYQWKVEQYDKRKTLLLNEPEPLPGVARASELPLKLYGVRGEFLHQRAVYYGLRSPPAGTTAYADTRGERSGYYVITPFRTTDGRVVLVNRGWIPRSQYGQWENVTQPEGEHTLVVAPSAAEQRAGPAPDLVRRIVYLLDPEVLREFTDCSGPVLDLVDTTYPADMPMEEALKLQRTSVLTLPIARTPHSYVNFYVTPTMHLSYAGTWFGLGMFGALMARSMLRGR